MYEHFRYIHVYIYILDMHEQQLENQLKKKWWKTKYSFLCIYINICTHIFIYIYIAHSNVVEDQYK